MAGGGVRPVGTEPEANSVAAAGEGGAAVPLRHPPRSRRRRRPRLRPPPRVGAGGDSSRSPRMKAGRTVGEAVAALLAGGQGVGTRFPAPPADCSEAVFQAAVIA